MSRDHIDTGGATPPSIKRIAAGATVFIGPTLTGPPGARTAAEPLMPELLRSFADFERIYGGLEDLRFADEVRANHVAHAARVYFDNGGSKLYVVRVERVTANAGARQDSAPTHLDYAAAFDVLERLDEPSLLAAPGHSAWIDGDAIRETLVTYVGNEDSPRHFLILDSPPQARAEQMQQIRAQIDTPNAAMYYPWVTISDSTAGQRGPQLAELHVPPSAFVCGILARNDRENGVWKSAGSPALKGALGLEQSINPADEEQLLAMGVNCFRARPPEGICLWGSRTTSSEPQWTYVNVRRYCMHLERCIARGLQWAASERNDEALWNKVRSEISDVLYAEWQQGAFAGARPEEAFFVRCDASTMSQGDIESGRLRCLVGAAITAPAEFVSLKIEASTTSAS